MSSEAAPPVAGELRRAAWAVDATALQRAALVGGALLYLVAYVAVALARLRYPFELQWMEGVVLDHVWRAADGAPIYVPPSLAFVPFLYTPLYYAVSAAAMEVFGQSFLPLRLVSLVASLGSMALLFAIARRESGSQWAAALAAGLFAATFPLSGFWFDLGRVDSLFLFLLLAGLWALSSNFPSGGVTLAHRQDAPGGETPRWGVSPGATWLGLRDGRALAAGALLGLAFLTKQTTLAVAVPVLLYVAWRDWRRAAAAGAAFALLVVGSTLVLDARSDGWYSFYTRQLPSQPYHLAAMVTPNRTVSFWTLDLARPLPIALAAAVLYGAATWRAAREGRGFWLVAGAAMVGAAWLLRAHRDADLNDLFPAHAALALGFGLGLAEARRWLATLPRPQGAVAERAVYSLALLQFAALLYNPMAQVPTLADYEAGARVVRTLREIGGEVWVPFHPYLERLAGRDGHAQAIPIGDVVRSRLEPARGDLVAETEQAIASQRFAAVLLDNQTYLGGMDFHRYYTLEQTLFDEDDEAFLPKTSSPVRPQFWYVPRTEE